MWYFSLYVCASHIMIVVFLLLNHLWVLVWALLHHDIYLVRCSWNLLASVYLLNLMVKLFDCWVDKILDTFSFLWNHLNNTICSLKRFGGIHLQIFLLINIFVFCPFYGVSFDHLYFHLHVLYIHSALYPYGFCTYESNQTQVQNVLKYFICVKYVQAFVGIIPKWIECNSGLYGIHPEIIF